MHIASGDLWAGAEVQIFTLCRDLLAQGDYQLHVITLNEGELAERFRYLGVAVTVLAENSQNFIQLLWAMRRELANIQPDVIHTHGQKQNILGALANFSGARVRCLRTVHGAKEHHFNIRKPHTALQLLLEILCGRWLQYCLIAVSKELEAQLAHNYQKNKIVLIHNGIDVAASTKTISSTKSVIDRSKAKIHIGLAGRLTQVKRPDLYLQAAAKLIKLHHSDQIHFHVIGEGPLRAPMMSLVREQDIDNQVTFHGHVPGAIKAISELDILVLCSDHEGLPMTLLEAVIAQTAVVAHNVGGMREVLEHKKTAILVDQHNADAYAKAISTLIDNAPLRQRLTNEAATLCDTSLSASHNAHQTSKCYQNSKLDN